MAPGSESLSDSMLCKLFQRSVWRQDIRVLSGLMRRAESSSRSHQSIARYAYCVTTLNGMEMRRLVSRISNSSSFVSWLLNSMMLGHTSMVVSI